MQPSPILPLSVSGVSSGEGREDGESRSARICFGGCSCLDQGAGELQRPRALSQVHKPGLSLTLYVTLTHTKLVWVIPVPRDLPQNQISPRYLHQSVSTPSAISCTAASAEILCRQLSRVCKPSCAGKDSGESFCNARLGFNFLRLDPWPHMGLHTGF